MKVLNVIFWIISLPIRVSAALVFIAMAMGISDWSSYSDRYEATDVVKTLLVGNLFK
jgi:hypothetical protein